MIPADAAPALLPAVVLLPLAAAVLAAVLPARVRPALGLGAALLSAVAALAVAALVYDAGAVAVHLGGHAPPLGIALRADGVAAAFLLLLAVAGTAVSVHAAASPPSTGAAASRDWFWPAWLLAWAGLAAVFVSGDLFNLYVALEVMGLAAVLLVALGGPGSWRPAFRYLLVAVTGSLLFLLALTLVYAATGTLDLALAGRRLAEAGDGPHRRAILALTLTGMALKSAVFPLHGWLPGTHGSAPSTVSPLLSALVVKASFVVALRVWTDVTGPDPLVGALVGVAAAGSVLWAGLVALRATHLKRLVAYSTISQLGYLFLVFPLLAAAGDDTGAAHAALAAVVTLALAHGLAKTAMFLTAGTLYDRLGTDRIDALTGRGDDHPALTMALGIAAVSLAGLPVTLGFAGKWQLLLAAIGTGLWWIVAVVIAGSVVAALYLLRPLRALFADAHEGAAAPGPDRGAAEPDRDTLPMPRVVATIPLALGLVSVAALFGAAPLADLVVVTLPAGGAP